MSSEYGVCWTSNTNNKFYFDKEDYDKIKDYCWFETSKGYICSSGINGNYNKKIYMHRLILDADKNKIVDHINHNKHDNRKCNLRICTQSENMMNTVLKRDNTSGVKGVWWCDRLNKWCSEIQVHNNKIVLGYFSNMNDAIESRKYAEEKYFGEYSYDNSINKNNDIDGNLL